MTSVSGMAAGILAVSLANAILLGWLGATIILNAERRSAGLWLTTAACLFGSAFFLVQTAIAGLGTNEINMAMIIQWPMGWFIGLGLPFAWYLAMLWHHGYWRETGTALHRRHRRWLVVAVTGSLGVLGLILLALRHPWSLHNRLFEPFAHPAIGRLPILSVAYPLVIVLCIALSLDALRHPPSAARLMDDLARRRARPWLAAASVTLLLVGLLVGAIMLSVAFGGRLGLNTPSPSRMPVFLVWADLIVSLLILFFVMLLGEAVVAHEIFTGKTLPRLGLKRQWRYALILGLGYGAVTTYTVFIEPAPFFGLLLAAVLVTGFYVLFGWRSYVERDRYLEHLRPFMAGPRVYDALLKQDPLQVDEAGAFAALCGGVLEARVAYLGAVGPLAVLAGPPLAYPPDTAPLAVFPDATAGGAAPDRLCFSVDPDRYGGAQWAVPLWSERGLIGLLLLGRKKSGGLYTQEEIEIARASAERLIDTLACARMAQTLMALQRRRLTDHQVENRRVHRAVHDEVLPRLHAAMLTAGASADTWTTETRPQLMEVHRQLSDLLRDMPPPTGLALARHGVVGMLRQAIENEFAESLDAVSWEIDPAAEEQARALPPVAAEVLFYAACEAIRNAARHGRGAGPQRPLHLRIAVTVNDAIETVIEDDGVGFDAMGGNAGRHGIALHGTMMAVVSGRWLTESAADRGTRVTLSIPLRP